MSTPDEINKQLAEADHAAKVTQARADLIQYDLDRTKADREKAEAETAKIKAAEDRKQIDHALRLALDHVPCMDPANAFKIFKGDVTLKASMAKLKAGRLVREVSDSCLQYWGGMGFMWDNPVSRVFRDGRLTSIGGGADEVMLSIIAKKMGIFPGK